MKEADIILKPVKDLNIFIERLRTHFEFLGV